MVVDSSSFVVHPDMGYFSALSLVVELLVLQLPIVVSLRINALVVNVLVLLYSQQSLLVEEEVVDLL